MNYRNLALKHLKLSEKLLNDQTDESLRYAALELRMAIEAITYDRVAAYKDELPQQLYETWQPKKLLSELLEVDQFADKESEIWIGLEEEYGVASNNMKYLGSEKVFDLKAIKKNYDALGSYLHMESLKNLREGKLLNYKKLRNRCEKISKQLNEAVSSPIFNCTIANFTTINCNGCELPIKKRIPNNGTPFNAKCNNCEATYTIEQEADDSFKWIPHYYDLECASNDCDQKIKLWEKEVKLGSCWKCSSCGGENTFVLAITHEK